MLKSLHAPTKPLADVVVERVMSRTAARKDVQQGWADTQVRSPIPICKVGIKPSPSYSSLLM